MNELLLPAPATKRATVKDIALQAGVAQPTVSVVLNGARSNIRISEPVRQRILDAARELGYRPNLAAQAMRRQNSRQVAVLVENNPACPLVHPLAWELLMGVNAGLEASGLLMSLVRLHDVTEEGHLASEVVEGHLFDGLIVVNHLPPQVKDRLRTLAPNTLWVDADVWEPHRCLRRDEVAAGATAVLELQALGYRKIIALHSPEHQDSHYHLSQRLAGARAAVSPEVEWREENVVLGPNQTSIETLFETLKPELRPDVAILAFDIYAARALGCLLAVSPLAVGREFGLACCDDDHKQANHGWAQLSRVQFDRFEMGRRAAEMLIKTLANPAELPASELLQGQWFPGSTCRSQFT